MDAHIEKVSTAIIDLFIDTPSSIEYGDMKLIVIFSEDNEMLVSEIPYEQSVIHYSYDLSYSELKSIEDFTYAIEISDGTITEKSPPMSLFERLPSHLFGILKKIRDDFVVTSRVRGGSDIYMFKRMPSGPKCLTCWDIDFGASNDSNCPDCNGLGFRSYYSKSYKNVGGPIIWNNEKYGVSDEGRVLENPSATMSSIADLVLVTDDILFHKNTGVWYRIKARTVSELSSTPVLQTLIMDRMPDGSPEIETAKKGLQI